MKMDKEKIEDIKKEIEQSIATASDAEREYWALSPDERARLPEHMRTVFDSVSG